MAVGKRRFQAEDWLALGLKELSARGPEAIKLAPICAAAGLTRGSFYYHFNDHDAFLVGMAETWLETQTTNVAAILKGLRDPDVQAETLTDAAMSIDYKLELGIRELARRNGDVADVVKRADNMRLSVLMDLYAARFDLERPEAWDMAHLEYAAFAGLILIDPEMSEERQRDLAARFDLIMRTFFATRDLETDA
ncbi:TetR/AcrR family transcriptional regulator [Cognatiyoonia sp. IB215446]|uniref:TetR/AcrR family transcriptional regulator n=1 Tax=Cognatiyoonia sp. IB215446 TaxID=3097355 RepID=UPI002A10FB16|nr:TetR/AcrR family transcriptional regulator [Cognatiyoonia sp. IB215446]MDX8348071.1 TetR/AcrR family transcriptional regulator [Cognatiyoonia sp. IB215446]